MGIVRSKSVYIANYFVPNDKKPGQGEDAQEAFVKLKLDKLTVDRLFDVFVKMDIDGAGSVDLDEFYRFFQFERSPFFDRVFGVFDDNYSGDIDFKEFVISMWNYCTLDFNSLVAFGFRLYDVDNSGFLNIDEVRGMIQEVYGQNSLLNTRLLGLYDELDSNKDGRLSLQEFKSLNDRFPTMLFPAFSVQLKLRKRVLGLEYWEDLLRRKAVEGAVANECLFETMTIMEEQRRQSDKVMLAELAQGRWMPTDLPPGTYIPEPSLSYKGRANARIAQRELLVRARVIGSNDTEQHIRDLKEAVQGLAKQMAADRRAEMGDVGPKHGEAADLEAKLGAGEEAAAAAAAATELQLDRTDIKAERQQARAAEDAAQIGKAQRAQLDRELNRALLQLKHR